MALELGVSRTDYARMTANAASRGFSKCYSNPLLFGWRGKGPSRIAEGGICQSGERSDRTDFIEVTGGFGLATEEKNPPVRKDHAILNFTASCVLTPIHSPWGF